MRTIYDNPFERKPGRKLGLMLVVSIAIHVALLLTRLPDPPPYVAALPPTSEPIEITAVPPEPPERRPEPPREATRRKEPEIAETEDAKNRKLDPNATILSDRTQTAEEQTKASRTDDFREKKGTGMGGAKGTGSIPPTGEPDAEEEKDSLEVAEGIGASGKKKGIKRDWRTLSLKDLSVGGDGLQDAATDDHLEGIREGDRTILSTREFRYFSYYHRIKELLRQYWKPAVETRMARMWAQGKTVRNEELVTRLLILLDEEGTIKKISRVGSSGMPEVDSAAVEAFERAAPFPNPPKGIIDPDGFVRIRWDFILKAEAGPVIQLQRAPGSPGPPQHRPMP